MNEERGIEGGGKQRYSTVRALGEVEMGETKRKRGEREEESVRGHERWCVVAKQRLVTKSPSILLMLPCPPSRPELRTHKHTIGVLFNCSIKILTLFSFKDDDKNYVI